MAESYNNVAVIYQAQGKYEESLEMHAKALDIRTRILGGDDNKNLLEAASWLLRNKPT